MEDWLVVSTQALIGLVVVAYILWPLFSSEPGEQKPPEPDPAEDDRADQASILINALRDLEYEYDTGKLDDEDYRRLYNHYGSELLEEYSEAELDDLLEGDVDREETRPEGPEPAGEADDELEAAIRRARDRLDESGSHPSEQTPEENPAN